MVVYGTQSGMEAAFGEETVALISDDNKDGVADTDVVARALAQASSFMDTFLEPYLPIATPYPDVVEQACYAIAGQNIRLPRDKGTEDSKLLYDNAVMWLKKVADGTATLPGDGDDSTPEPGSPELYAEPRAWTRTTSGGVF